MSSICVHGLGYIGLPTAAMFANYGHDVAGYDVDDGIVARLADGEVHIDEPGLRAFVHQATESGKLEFTDQIVPAEYHVIAVPTPFDQETKRADLSYVRAASKAVTSVLRENDTVILESTVPPGTTASTVKPVLENGELTVGEDVDLVHCPETVLPGNIITELKRNDRIVGGTGGSSLEGVVQLYKSFVEGDIRTTSDATTAEFVKLVQNTYRDTNIALANEVAKLARDYGIDSREAIELANRHPRVGVHRPGPGVGGHCLPIDPWFLGQESDELNLIAHAREVNDSMTGYVIDILDRRLEGLDEATIAILGVAYKAGVSDTRMSPGLRMARQLQFASTIEAPTVETTRSVRAAPTVSLHDPHVTDQTLDLSPFPEAIDGADAAVITTGHDEYADLEPENFGRMDGSLVVDTHAILDREQWRKDDFELLRI